MSLEELKAKRQKLQEASNATLNNMTAVADEFERVADVARDSRKILDNLDEEFERQTGLNSVDARFLCVAILLQLARIVLMQHLNDKIDEFTKPEKAGQGNKNEKAIHDFQEKIFGKFENGERLDPTKYNAPFNQIISTLGVPYDVTKYGSDEMRHLHLFNGANHRFSTMGHDPILGLIFGTTNILTNTITCTTSPIISTFHVTYDINIKNPKITEPASTILALKYATERCRDDMKSVVAAVIKQILHIGTDLYTKKGIQLPGANLILSNANVEKITEHVSTGDVIKIGVKVGASAGLSTLINFLIATVHNLMYDETKYENRDVYNVKTRKIIMYSNALVSSGNLAWVGANVVFGDKSQIKNLDIGGLTVTINRLLTDTNFIQKVKEEFVFGNFDKLIQGEKLELEEVKLWE